MLITVLVLLFIAIFVFITWRIIMSAKAGVSQPSPYVCPDCDELDCICQKKSP